jgi:hypothetical protein
MKDLKTYDKLYAEVQCLRHYADQAYRRLSSAVHDGEVAVGQVYDSLMIRNIWAAKGKYIAWRSVPLRQFRIVPPVVMRADDSIELKCPLRNYYEAHAGLKEALKHLDDEYERVCQAYVRGELVPADAFRFVAHVGDEIVSETGSQHVYEVVSI